MNLLFNYIRVKAGSGDSNVSVWFVDAELPPFSAEQCCQEEGQIEE